ncbi:Protein of unknown function [Saccharopolyspora flava]|uniref:Uncharacterized protein n=1 Tax=Saccharopolyspora flava TaxID=95161 RepID=A0A1I6PT00_9PSEU|nr:Protein of unknown function [Saccharopolyspora flava]
MSRKRVVGRTGARFGSAAMRETWEEAEAEEDDLPPDEDDSIAELSGARFGSPSLRRRWKREAELAREPESEALQPIPPPPEPEPEPEPETVEVVELAPPPRLPETQWDEPPASLIRPYAHTAGRTRAHLSLPLEALISATGRCPLDDRPPEWRTISGLCAAPRWPRSRRRCRSRSASRAC